METTFFLFLHFRSWSDHGMKHGVIIIIIVIVVAVSVVIVFVVPKPSLTSLSSSSFVAPVLQCFFYFFVGYNSGLLNKTYDNIITIIIIPVEIISVVPMPRSSSLSSSSVASSLQYFSLFFLLVLIIFLLRCLRRRSNRTCRLKKSFHEKCVHVRNSWLFV